MESESKLSTSSLFHYTSSKENIIKILSEGFHPKYSLEKLGILKKDDFLIALSELLAKPILEEEITDEFAIPMSCFCDIPLDLVEKHIKVYGNFAIGMTKEWGERQAICPVFYVPKKGESRFLLEMLLRKTHKLIPQLKARQKRIDAVPLWKRNISNEILGVDLIDLMDRIINLVMYIKPYSGPYERANIGFKEDDYKFYDEREWRYKPSRYLAREFLTKEEYSDEKLRKDANESMGFLSFEKDDITDIICLKDDISDIRAAISRIKRLNGIDLGIVNTIENKTKIKI